MSGIELRELSDRELVRCFRDYALEQAEALTRSDTGKYNRLYKKIAAIEAELRARGPRARAELLVLLDDSNLRVRFEAARRCLAVDRDRAVTTLKEIIASHQMPEEGAAGMTLWSLETGDYKPT